MFGHRHDLHVGESGIPDVIGQLVGDAAIVHELALLVAPPRTQMNLVHGPRTIQSVAPSTVRHPVPILPCILQVPDDGRRGRRSFAEKGKRVGALAFPASPAQVVLVALAVTRLRHETLPDPGTVGAHGHGRGGAVPLVEIADNRDKGRIGGPDYKPRSCRARAQRFRVGSEMFIETRMPPLFEEINVEIAKT